MKHSSKRLRQYYAAPFAVGAHQTSSMLFVAGHAWAAVTDSVSRSHDNIMWMAILRPVMPLQVQRCARSLQRTLEGSRKGDISHTSKQDCLSADLRRALIQRCMEGTRALSAASLRALERTLSSREAVPPRALPAIKVAASPQRLRSIFALSRPATWCVFKIR